jgi:hypothetical protein
MSEILTKNVMLPTKPAPVARLSPKILVLYGVPKVGKTKVITDLPGCLILDTEDGAGMYECMRVPIMNPDDFYNFGAALKAEVDSRRKAGLTGADVYPYKYMCIDTLDKLEEYTEEEATRKYKKSVMGKDFKGGSVIELAHGLGYYYTRQEMLIAISELSKLVPHLILNVHVKEKLLDKKGEQVKVNDISLTGKLGAMVCAKADAIGYLFREGNTLKVSFETSESHVMGARQPHLAGKKFDFSWDKIFIDDESLKTS